MRLYMPTKVFFGSGCVSENGAELKALGSRANDCDGKTFQPHQWFACSS
mgnify:CR=1 FL=1